MHTDWEKTGDGWRIGQVWMCRQAVPNQEAGAQPFFRAARMCRSTDTTGWKPVPPNSTSRTRRPEKWSRPEAGLTGSANLACRLWNGVCTVRLFRKQLRQALIVCAIRRRLGEMTGMLRTEETP